MSMRWLPRRYKRYIHDQGVPPDPHPCDVRNHFTLNGCDEHGEGERCTRACGEKDRELSKHRARNELVTSDCKLEDDANGEYNRRGSMHCKDMSRRESNPMKECSPINSGSLEKVIVRLRLSG
jgi:hypothetical protein